MVLKQISVVLRQVSIASRHSEGVQVAWRWCGNQNDDGVGAAMGGVEANSDGVDTQIPVVFQRFCIMLRQILLALRHVRGVEAILRGGGVRIRDRV